MTIASDEFNNTKNCSLAQAFVQQTSVYKNIQVGPKQHNNI
jgi:hypothetical protein